MVISRPLKILAYFLLFLLLITLYNLLTGPRFGAVIEGLTPPELPEIRKREQRWLDQNWSRQTRQKFYNISQGTQTIPVPLDWFLALEQPRSSAFKIFFGSEDGFSDSAYLQRFGFIGNEKNAANPHGLPIGFSITTYQSIDGTSSKGAAVGLTCAACHTGRLTVADTDYLVDGGPSVIDVGLLSAAIGAAVGQTFVSARLPFFRGRFERFARNVLKADYSDANQLKLQAQLESVITRLADTPNRVKTIEGPSRLDALNRIGNEVFAIGPHRYKNYTAIDSPVNYPHLWTASWFDWVQYDGSIMQPVVRNAGEALGVNSNLNTSAPAGEGRFSSSVNMKNLLWIERSLAGPTAPYPGRKFTGLLAPVWPTSFGKIDPDKKALGAALYASLCQACHLPPLNSDAIWGLNQHKPPRPYFGQVTYYVDDKPRQTADKLLSLNLISIDQVGTDPGQANILARRTVDTAGIGNLADNENTSGLGIKTEVCTWAPDVYDQKSNSYEFERSRQTREHEYGNKKLVNVTVRDGPNVNFALALGAVVQQANEVWFKQNFITEEEQSNFEGGRPNCLQAGRGYKARPLNGVWATAPFLHNGSVPTLMDLLGPPEERPEFVQLGSTEFDLQRIGIKQNPKLTSDGEPYSDGLFFLDTSLPGNSNRGHEFSNEYNPDLHYLEQKQGVIGPAIAPEQRQAIIEFLKSLSQDR